MNFSPAAIINGKKLHALLRSGTRYMTKIQIENALSLSPSQAQRAIDWCRANRLVTVDPFFALNEDGSWTYGYRHTTAEVDLFTVKEMNYILTRVRTNISVVDHVLDSKAALSRNMTRRDKALYKAHLSSLQAAEHAIEAVGQQAAARLVP